MRKINRTTTIKCWVVGEERTGKLLGTPININLTITKYWSENYKSGTWTDTTSRPT